jgi:hypothetical protein
MRPKERREVGEQDLFRSRLDQIIDLEHALVKLAKAIDWRFLEEKFGEAYSDRPGHPPLPTRLMAGLAILKHSYDLSDEGLCERWVENPYFQYFCGEEFVACEERGFQADVSGSAAARAMRILSSKSLSQLMRRRKL